MLTNIKSAMLNIHKVVFGNSKKPAKIDNIQLLINDAENQKLFYERLDLKTYENCDFISCGNQAVLFLEGFYVCEDHGFILIKRLTEKTKYDTVVEDD